MPEPTSRHQLEEARRTLPGCGFGLYAVILLVFFALGVAGIVGATLTVFAAGDDASPFSLTYGGNVEPSLLGPMRAAGLVGADEVPDAFHTEDMLGSAACGIQGDRFLRIGPEGAFTLPLAAITAHEVPDGVEVVGEGRTVLCRFLPGQGGDRFVRMLNAR